MTKIQEIKDNKTIKQTLTQRQMPNCSNTF